MWNNVAVYEDLEAEARSTTGKLKLAWPAKELANAKATIEAMCIARLWKPSTSVGLDGSVVINVQPMNDGRWWMITFLPTLYPMTVVDFGTSYQVRESWLGPFLTEYLPKLCYHAQEWLQAGEEGLCASSMPVGWQRKFP